MRMAPNKSSKIRQFLDQYPKVKTQQTYVNAFNKFFGLFYDDDSLDDKCNMYFKNGRDYVADVKAFYKAIMNLSKSTIRTYLSTIKTFFIESDILIPDKVWRRLRRLSRNAKGIAIDTVPTAKMLRNLFSHMPIQGKALFLCMVSSGMRIGETLALTPDDIDLKTRPARIYVRAENTKGNVARIVFVSSEASETIEEWLKSRSAYFKAKRSRILASSPDPLEHKLFPFTSDNARTIWKVACRKSNLDTRIPSTNRFAVHPHTLRKYFRTKLGAVIPVDVVEQLMGHRGYLTDAYRRHSEEELAKWYLEGEPALLLSTDTASMVKVQHELESQQRFHDVLVRENIEHKSKISSLEDAVHRLAEQVQDLTEANSINKLLSKASPKEREALIKILSEDT